MRNMKYSIRINPSRYDSSDRYDNGMTFDLKESHSFLPIVRKDFFILVKILVSIKPIVR